MNRSRNLLFALGTVVVAAPPAAGQSGVTVVGSVLDAEINQRLARVVVYLDGADLTAASDSAGVFRLDGVTPGNHTITLSRAGFTPRMFQFTVPDGQAAPISLGEIALEISTGPVITLLGSVRQPGGAPIPQVPIRVNDRVLGVSDDGGTFRIVTGAIDPDGPNVIEARRLGFQPAIHAFNGAPEERGLQLDFILEPAAVRLGDVAVESDRPVLATGRMTGFYERQARGFGNFFTREDIEKMGAQQVTDVIRRVPGARIFSEESWTRAPSGNDARIPLYLQEANVQRPKITVRFQRAGFTRDVGGGPCSPLIFVNDVQVHEEGFDWLIPANQVVGMEVYSSASQVPGEYNARGAACGVIVLWTDRPVGGAVVAKDLEVGGHMGGRVESGVLQEERVGVQFAIPLFGMFEFHPGFNLIFGDTSGRSKRGWQATANIKARPVPFFSPLYVGTGVTFIKLSTAFGAGFGSGPGSTDAFHVLLGGVSLPVGPVRPFFELQVLDGFSGRPDAYTFLGLTVRSR